ncbi:hypothetical protein BBJ28_00000463 [Nothophytophthora sp. Chile5]|nr:hypothetical protein BBJ28_00000463 [Nothophytophthora sp. Chile5]
MDNAAISFAAGSIMELPAPLLAVRLLFLEKIGLGALPHVISATSAFLDSSVELPLAKACKFGSLALLDRIWESSNQFVNADGEPEATSWCVRKMLRTERHYTLFQFTQALSEAVRRQELAMVEWLFSHFPGLMVRNGVVKEAAAAGSLELLRYFLENDSSGPTDGDGGDRNVLADGGREVQWGVYDTTLAAKHGQHDVLRWLLMHTGGFNRRDLNETVLAAVGSGDVPMVEWLLEHHNSAGLHLRPEMGMHVAAANGHVAMLQWLMDRNCFPMPGVLVKAAENGHLDVVRWLIELDWAENESDSDSHSDSDNDDGYDGFRYGFTRKVRYRRPVYLTDLGGEASLAIHAAAVNGHLEVAEYLRARVDTPLNSRQQELHEHVLTIEQKGISIHIGPLNQAKVVSGATMLEAARKGFLDIVRWLYDEFSVNPSIDLFRYGSHENMRRDEGSIAMNAAATNGHLEIVQYLHEVGTLIKAENTRKRKREEIREAGEPTERLYPRTVLLTTTAPPSAMDEKDGPWCTPAAMDGAAGNNHLDVVQWLHKNRTEGCSARAMDLAAGNGHLEMVKWLHNHRTEGCTTDAMDDAACGGHLVTVQWLHEHTTAGCTTRAMDGAARKGHIETVKWLHEHRSEGCTKAAMDNAARSGSLELVKWLQTNRTEGCTTGAMDEAAWKGRLRVVRWLQENRSEGCTTMAMDNAAIRGEFETVLFLHATRSEGCTDDAVTSTQESNMPDINAWILRHVPAFQVAVEDYE